MRTPSQLYKEPAHVARVLEHQPVVEQGVIPAHAGTAKKEHPVQTECL